MNFSSIRFDDLFRWLNDFFQALSGPRHAQPINDVEAKNAARRVLDEYGLQKMKVEIPDGAVGNQTRWYRGSVPFEKALRAALDSYLNDGSDQESPLAVVRNTYEGWIDQGAMTAKDKLRQLMNNEQTKLSVMTRDLSGEGGEKLSANWLFELEISGDKKGEMLSTVDHFAVVDRQGRNPARNYGFD